MNQIGEQLKIISRKLYIPKYVVSDHAPETLKDVVTTYNETKKLIIWSGASENTIYGCAELNYLARAWHDYTHVKLLSEFNLQGEIQTALKQMSQVDTKFAEVLRIEIIEQVNYFQKHGEFPENQLKFFKSFTEE